MIFSDIEFYYTPPELISSGRLIVTGDEAIHITKVMRHKVNDEVYITDGSGNIFKTVIENITPKEIISKITGSYVQENNLTNVTFCIPILKSAERLEFALEKSVELGITDFVIFNAEKSYKRGIKLDRWEKILLAAMKQSLRSYKPKIEFRHNFHNSFSDSDNLFIFEQNSDISFQDFLKQKIKTKYFLNNKTYFIFGPEGGLTQKEIALFNNPLLLTLNKNRLRSETAIINVAVLLANL